MRVEVRANFLSSTIGLGGAGSRVFEEEEIRESGATRLGEFLEKIPGFSGVSLRGLPDGNILVFWNGIRLNDPTNPSAAFDFSRLALGGVETIRIVRGPEAGIWGSGSTGAAIFVETQDVVFGMESPRPELGLSAGSLSTYRSRAQLARSGESFALNALVGIEGSDGFSSASERYKNMERDGFQRQNAFVVGSYSLQKGLRLQSLLLAENSRLETDKSGGAGGDAPDFGTHDSSLRAALRLERGEPESPWVHSLSVETSLDARDSRRPPSRDRYIGRRIRIEDALLYKIDSSQQLRASLGIEFEQSLSREDSVRSDAKRNTLDLRGVYSKSGKVWNYKMGLSAETPVGDLEARAPLPWAFFVAPSRVFASTKTRISPSLGYSFKKPSLYQLYSAYGDTSLRAERAWTAELSLLQDLSSVSSHLELTYFWTRATETLDFDLARSSYQNGDHRRSDGIEALLATKLAPDLTLRSEHVWTRSPVLRVPTHKSSLDLSWAASEQSHLSTKLLRVGSRPDIDAVSFQSKTLPAHILWNLQLSHRWSRDLEAYLRVDNVLDKDYENIDGYGTSGRYFETGLRIFL